MTKFRTILNILTHLGFHLVLVTLGFSEQNLTSIYTTDTPTIDGNPSDMVWTQAIPIITKDGATNDPISIRSLHTDEEIFFLAKYQDSSESRLHRPWIWNDQLKMYEVGPQREDCFIFKWFMEPYPDSLYIDSGENHTADTWFWKANRTDAAGFADDKIQRLTAKRVKKATKIMNQSGKVTYLQRSGDRGKPAYKDKIYVDYQGPQLERFLSQQPSGSRADIKARGQWHQGYWTIEFSRRLVTGNSDDIQFGASNYYVFGISRFEIAGREPNPKIDQPLYGAGRLSERLLLSLPERTLAKE